MKQKTTEYICFDLIPYGALSFYHFEFIQLIFSSFFSTAEDEQKAESASCGKALIVLSWVLVVITMPFSLFVCFKVSQTKIDELPPLMAMITLECTGQSTHSKAHT